MLLVGLNLVLFWVVCPLQKQAQYFCLLCWASCCGQAGFLCKKTRALFIFTTALLDDCGPPHTTLLLLLPCWLFLPCLAISKHNDSCSSWIYLQPNVKKPMSFDKTLTYVFLILDSIKRKFKQFRNHRVRYLKTWTWKRKK